MRVVVFIADIQDIWLFNYFFERCKDYKIVYDSSRKITSPHLYVQHLSSLSKNLIQFRGLDDDEFKQAVDECDYFITKECLPFKEDTEEIKKVIGISWVGESVAKSHDLFKNAPPNNKIILKTCDKFYVERHFQSLYKKRGYDVIPTSPKYYFLNKFTRETLCRELALDPNKKYFTLFLNPNISLEKRIKVILEHIQKTSKELGYTCIIKNKMKYGDYMRSELQHDVFCDGSPSFYHTGIMLQAISEFSVGFATCASVESEIISSRFISFWKHDWEEDIEKISESVIEVGNGYRLANSQDTFNVCTLDTLDDIVNKLDVFILKSSSRDFSKKFKEDDFLRSLR